MNQTIIDALQWRYATKVFDPAKKVSDEDLRTVLESGRLAPSIVGLEPWKFLVIQNPEIRQQIRLAAWDQPKVTDASHLIVLAMRTDARENMTDELLDRAAKTHQVHPSTLNGLRQTAEGVIAARDDQQLHTMMFAQAFLALGLMVETASLLGIDNGPMAGGVDIDEVLGLAAQNLTSAAMLTLGYRGEDPAAARKKVRRAFDEVVTTIQ